MSEKREKPVQALSYQPSTGPENDLEQVYQAHSQRVLRAAYRVTGSMDDAQDVLQTVFLRLARRDGVSRLSDNPASYLHRAAINAGLDLIRSRQSQRATALEAVEPVLEDTNEPSPERSHVGTELNEKIREILSRMSPTSAEIFTLRYFEGYGNNEIAEMLGKSRSTVNVILHRTREKLRNELASYVGETQ